jgi:protein-S-isoprenylcysteine O-methyltransferase Ste14
MDALSIAKAITRAVLVTVVLAVFSFSLLLAPEVNAETVTGALIKGFLTLVFGWIFILILSDTMVKSIAASARESKASRRDGGMLYHFIKMEKSEVSDETKEPTKPVAKPA